MVKEPKIEKEKLASFPKKPIFALIIMLIVIVGGTFLAKKYLLEKKENNEVREHIERIDEGKTVFKIPEDKYMSWTQMIGTTNDERSIEIQFQIAGFGEVLAKRQPNNAAPDQIFINEQEIAIEHYINGVGRIGENIYIHYYNHDLKTADLIFYNQNGEELFVYSKVQSDNYFLLDESIYHNDQEVFFEGTKIIDNQVYLDEQVIPLCEKENWQEKSDTPVIVRYTIDYHQNTFEKLPTAETISTLQETYQEANCE